MVRVLSGLAALLAVGLLVYDDLAPGSLLIGVALLAFGDLLERPGAARNLLPARLVVLGSGAVLVGASVAGSDGVPSGALAVVGLLATAWGWPRLGRDMSSTAAVLLAVWSVVGVYATVPDTEEIVIAGAVAIPALGVLGVLSEPGRFPAASGLWGVIAWAAVQGGRGRPGAVVGATACLVLLAVAPLAWRVARGARPTPLRRLGVAVVHVGAVLLVSRWAGLQPSGSTAAIIAGIVLGVALVADIALLRGSPAR